MFAHRCRRLPSAHHLPVACARGPSPQADLLLGHCCYRLGKAPQGAEAMAATFARLAALPPADLLVCVGAPSGGLLPWGRAQWQGAGGGPQRLPA